MLISKPKRTPEATLLRRISLKKRSFSFVIAASSFSLIVLLAWLAPLLSQHSPYEQVLLERLQPPSWEHPLGTDPLGRDILARLLYGGRFSLLLTAIVVTISASLGSFIGLLAAYFGGWLEEIILRILDLFTAFPSFAVALIIAALLKPNFWTLVLALCLTAWTPYARLARAVGLELNSKAFIEAAKALGGGDWHLIYRHILPNALRPLIATVFLRYGHTLLSISGLSFLGLGAQPPTADWGLMLAEARPYMQRLPLLVLVPGLSIFVTSLSVSLMGQAMIQSRSKNI